jgi:hypothetical protein
MGNVSFGGNLPIRRSTHSATNDTGSVAKFLAIPRVVIRRHYRPDGFVAAASDETSAPAIPAHRSRAAGDTLDGIAVA